MLLILVTKFYIDHFIPSLQFVGRLIEEGAKSPRTIRLAALHLTGLWLLNPWTLKYYMKELKLLTLYGSGELILSWFMIYCTM